MTTKRCTDADRLNEGNLAPGFVLWGPDRYNVEVHERVLIIELAKLEVGKGAKANAGERAVPAMPGGRRH